MIETRAFVISTTITSLLYWFYTTLEHWYLHGVISSGGIGFFLLILLFASAGTVFLAIPTYLILLKTKLDKNWILVLFGTSIGGIIIGSSNNGILWQHPEGFVAGLIASLVFIALRKRKYA